MDVEVVVSVIVEEVISRTVEGTGVVVYSLVVVTMLVVSVGVNRLGAVLSVVDETDIILQSELKEEPAAK